MSTLYFIGASLASELGLGELSLQVTVPLLSLHGLKELQSLYTQFGAHIIHNGQTCF